MKCSLFFSCLASLLLLATAYGTASATDIFTYQGKLVNAGGAALADGQYRIGVRIWDVASGGETPLWARKYDVPVVGGSFSLMIGSEGDAWETPEPLTSALKLAVAGNDRFLEITVMSEGNGEEKSEKDWQVLAPRQTLSAVPYAMNGVPVGTVVPFAGAVIPEGWVLCNGANYSSLDARYKALSDVIGTLYGNSGSNTFRVPDLNGRTVIGTGSGDTRSTDDTLPPTNWGLTLKFGTERHKMTELEMPSHSHAVTDPGHSHKMTVANYVGGKFYATNISAGSDNHFVSKSPNTSHVKTGIYINNSGSSQHHNNMQPILVLHYIIKL